MHEIDVTVYIPKFPKRLVFHGRDLIAKCFLGDSGDKQLAPLCNKRRWMAT